MRQRGILKLQSSEFTLSVGLVEIEGTHLEGMSHVETANLTAEMESSQ